jgi:dTDP-4-amino-4,6-dideoxygalactose transaminase
MIPFLDLKAQYQSIKAEVEPAVLKVLESCGYVLGPEVKAFEEEFATYIGARHAIACNTGTSALHLAFLSAGIGPGDEVITVPHTFVATVAAIRYTGARPVFVDIDPVSFTMDPSKIEAKITAKTKAIVPVHLYGQTADMDPILEIAKRRNLLVIQDAAQAHGAEYKGRKLGTMGDAVCYSFYPGKNLGAAGEGGLVATNRDDWNRLARMHRDWGAERKYEHEIEGYNYRMDGVQGAILRIKLRRLPQWNAGRQRAAARYDQLLAGTCVQPPKKAAWGTHVYHVYAVRTTNRTALQAWLSDRQVATNIHYPHAIHRLPAHADLGYKAGDFPHAEKAAAEVLSLPMYPELTDAQIQTVVDAIKEFPGRG